MTAHSRGATSQDNHEVDKKSALGLQISQRIRSLRLTRAAASGMLGVESATVDRIMRGQFGDFSEDQLTDLVSRLGVVRTSFWPLPDSLTRNFRSGMARI